MEWTIDNLPLELRDLDPKVRDKALAIANKLKAEGKLRELSIIPEAIKQAQNWFLNEEG